MRVGSVVLHYRFWPGLRETLNDLLSQTRPPDIVIVVDNHSDDGSVSEIRNVFPQLEVIETDQNGGYGAGMNVGIGRLLHEGTDAILLLTHECRLAPTTLELLATRLEQEASVAAVGPLLGFASNPTLVFSGGGEVDAFWGTLHRRRPRRIDEWIDRSPSRVQALDGAALLLRSKAVRAAGPFDESYFMYFEETEYLLKLQRLGWWVECVPTALAWQEPGTKSPYLWDRNRLRFLARNASAWALTREIARLASGALRDGLLPRSEPVRTEARARLRALRDFLARRWGPDSTDGIETPKEASGLIEEAGGLS
jgi:GT2 family glycosyltransferase